MNSKNTPNRLAMSTKMMLNNYFNVSVYNENIIILLYNEFLFK